MMSGRLGGEDQVGVNCLLRDYLKRLGINFSWLASKRGGRMVINDYWKRTVSETNEILQKTEQECKPEFMLLTDSLSLYASAFHAMPSKGDGDALIARLALLSQSLNTLRTSIYAASTGYYIQSLIPLRHVYETWLSFWYLAKFPNEAMKWLTPRTRPPSAKELLDKIDHPSEDVKSQVREFYGELNRFVHVDPVTAISRIHGNEEKTMIDVGIRFNAEDFRACAYGIVLWVGMMLDAVSSLVSSEDAWHNEHKAIADRIVVQIEGYNALHGGAPIPPEEGADATG